MTGYTLLHIATILVFILLVVALAALIDWIFGTWKKPLLPPVKRKVTWCDTHGHKIVADDGFWVCAHCAGCWYRHDRVPVFLGPVDPAELLPISGPEAHARWTA